MIDIEITINLRKKSRHCSREHTLQLLTGDRAISEGHCLRGWSLIMGSVWWSMGGGGECYKMGKSLKPFAHLLKTG